MSSPGHLKSANGVLPCHFILNFEQNWSVKFVLLLLSCFRTDPMQLDSILSEMALSNAHTELYFKFVRKKFVVSADHV